MQYNLSIHCVDGDTTYGLISSNKKLLYNFLKEHDHEGSTLSLIKRVGGLFVDIDYDNIYKELEEV